MGTAILTSLQNISAQPDLEEISTGWKLGIVQTQEFTIDIADINFSKLQYMNHTNNATEPVMIGDKDYAPTRDLTTGGAIFTHLIPFTTPIEYDVFAFQRKTEPNIMKNNINQECYAAFNSNYGVFNKYAANSVIEQFVSFGTLFLGASGMNPAYTNMGFNSIAGRTQPYYSGEQLNGYRHYNVLRYFVNIGLTDLGISLMLTGGRITKVVKEQPFPSGITVSIPALSIPYWHL